MSEQTGAEALAAAADSALADVLTPTGVELAPASGSEVVDALVVAGLAAGIEVADHRRAQVSREPGLDVPEAARRLGVPVRRVRLTGVWWQTDSGPYVVGMGAEGFAAAVPRRNAYLLVRSGVVARLTAAVAREVNSEGWAVTPRLPEQPLHWRQLSAAVLRGGSAADALLILVAAIATAVLGIAVPVLAGSVIGGLVPRGEVGRVWAVGVLLVAVAVAAAGLAMLESVLLQRLATRVDTRLVAALLDRLVRLPLGFFRVHRAGELVQRIQGLDALGYAATSAIFTAASALLLAVSGAVVMLVLNPALAGMVLLALAAAGIPAAWVLHRQVRARARYVEASLHLSASSLSMFAGIAKIRAAAAEERMEALWSLSYAKQQRAARDALTGVQRLSMIATFLPILVTFCVVAGSFRSSDQLGLGQFTSFVAAAGQTAGALAAMLSPLLLMVGLLPTVRAIRPLLEAVPEAAGFNAKAVELRGEIEVSQVSFAYEPGVPVLSEVSLRIEPGEFVAIVGPSGSGKSTLLRMLIGIERPDRGEVLFDGEPLDRLGVDAVRRQLGVVGQSAQLSTGTIRANILGTSDLTEADAWEAAEAAGIAADIRAMPMGMNTLVSDGAASFSGGQKQRIMLARALARRPRILLLDEATSALDNATQAQVARTMSALGATRVVVAHRLSTIRNADRVVVLDAGRVVESGTFEEVLAAGGIFATMVDRQQL